MKPVRHVIAIAAAILSSPTAAAGAQRPLISMQAARARAWAWCPHGQMRSAELEREHGKLIYSFDIQVPHRAGVEEVQISALTGGLVSRAHESGRRNAGAWEHVGGNAEFSRT